MNQTVSSSIASSPAAARRSRLKGALIGLVLGAAVAAGVPALAAGFGGHHEHGGPGHHERGGPGGGFMGHPGHIERLLKEVDATEQQRTQIRQITEAAAADLKGERENGRKRHQQMMALFAQPNVDAAAVESLRQQSIASADRSSRRMTQAMLDVARVLTPEQRAKLGQQMAERQRRFEQRLQERGQQRPDAPLQERPRQP